MRHLTSNELQSVSGGDGAGATAGLGVAILGAAAALTSGAAQSVYNQGVIQDLQAQPCPNLGSGVYAILCA